MAAVPVTVSRSIQAGGLAGEQTPEPALVVRGAGPEVQGEK